MSVNAEPDTTWIVRRVFAGWSVTIPSGFDEPDMGEEDYWHTYDTTHSVSLSSVAVTEGDHPVPSVALARRVFQILPRGEPVAESPTMLLAKAWIIDVDPPSRASRALTGMVVADGRVLLATITSDDPDWVRRVWRSIEHHDVPPVTRPLRQTADRPCPKRARSRR